MNRAGRVLAVFAGIAVAVALTTYYIVSYLMMTPPSVDRDSAMLDRGPNRLSCHTT